MVKINCPKCNKSYNIEGLFKQIATQIDINKERWIFEIQSGESIFSFVCKATKDKEYINIYGRNITKSKRDQQELERLSLIIHETQNAVVVTDKKPTLVILPVQVSSVDGDYENEFGTALYEGLHDRFEVFSGSIVKDKLKKEYEKIDCDAVTCQQNIAIEFNAEKHPLPGLNSDIYSASIQ